MTKEEIVNETVKYYSEDVNRRSFIDNHQEVPVFINDDDLDIKLDAVGRCLLPEVVEQLRKHDNFDEINEESVSNLVKSLNVQSLDDLLKEEYRGHDEEFWIDLQGLHDEHENWDENGITKKGQEVADDIIRTSFNLDRKNGE